MEEFFETLKSITSLLGSVIALLGSLGLISRKMRVLLAGYLQRITGVKDTAKNGMQALDELRSLSDKMDGILKSSGTITDALKDVLRNNITHIYYKYRVVKKIPMFERQNLIAQYESYHRLLGNSYVTHLFEEMCEWETTE